MSSPHEVGRPVGSTARTAHKPGSGATQQITPIRQHPTPSIGAGGCLERKLLAKMTAADGMTKVIESGIGTEVFEDPTNRRIYAWMIDEYWPTDHTPPTMLALAEKFPSVELPAPADVEETTSFLVKSLTTRYSWNQLQRLLIDHATTEAADDPQGALSSLIEQAQHIRDQSGRAVDSALHLRDRLLRVDELRTLPLVKPLISGLLYQDTLAQLAGPPGCYKSFAVTAMACALASGEPFGSHTVPRAGIVVYVAAEGSNNMAVRILAWCEVAGVDPAQLDGRLHVLPLPVQLGDMMDVTQAVEIVRELGADLLILDTRARCTLGLDENSATEQSKAIAAADQMRDAAGCTVLSVHHSGTSTTRGRGSTAWDGAVWSDLHMEGKALHATIKCHKHKDVQSGCEHHFGLVRHTVSANLMPGTLGPERETLVLAGNGAGIESVSANSQRVVLEVIRNSAPPEGLTGPQVREFAEALGVKKSAVYMALKALVAEGHVENVGSVNRSRYFAAGGAR